MFNQTMTRGKVKKLLKRIEGRKMNFETNMASQI